jgi:hypothetical protein
MILVVAGIASILLNIVTPSFLLPTVTRVQIEVVVSVAGIMVAWAGRLMSYSMPYATLLAYSFSRRKRPIEDE